MIVTYSGHHTSPHWRFMPIRESVYKQYVPDYFWHGVSACVWIVPGTVEELYG